jgi:carbamoyltransferase
MSREKKPWVLGISASHNGGACLLHGDRIVAAIQEERLVRTKRQRVFGARSSLSVNYCLDYGNITAADLNMVVLCAQGKARSHDQDISLNPQLQVSLHGIPTEVISHHMGHAMSAFALSGFKEAAILVIDGLGSPNEDLRPDEQAAAIPSTKTGWESISLYHAGGVMVTPLEKHLVEDGQWLIKRKTGMPLFGSLGGMYSAVAMQIFGDPLEAGQVMGLAPYGIREFAPEDFFELVDGLFRFHDRVPSRFMHQKRWPKCRRQYQNLACSVQKALEESVLYLAQHLLKRAGSENLCYAGGVALNCVVNELLHEASGFKRFHIAPAAEDSGPAIGAAYYGLWKLLKRNTRQFLSNDALGRAYSKSAIDAAVERTPGVTVAGSKQDLLGDVVERLCAGQFAGWFQGGSEMGPRALGHRSILADPRNPTAKTLLNARIKARASFRPFAPSILQEEVGNWFETDGTLVKSPFMLRTWRFKSTLREKVPAVVHIDGTGRAHTVDQKSNPLFYSLLRRFYEKTKIPLLLNTSFNGRAEPIVETPDDALWCLLFTGLDFCVLGDRLVVREKGLRSVLDLYPRVILRSYSIESATDGNPFRAKLTSNSNLVLRTNSAWGEAEYSLPGSIIAVLRLIDGRTSGWALLKKLSLELGAELEQSWLLDTLAALHRMSVITFTESPQLKRRTDRGQ